MKPGTNKESQNSKPLTNENSVDTTSDKLDQDIELLDIEPKKRINPEDRKNLQRVLEVINQHLPDRMLTSNPLKNEIDSRIRDNQTQPVGQSVEIKQKVAK
ncbi:hypothetical protein GF337_08945 [candidate division KSB1 bacterium]|nr:hypothetical protein [candidate division KSB1 bacterium]